MGKNIIGAKPFGSAHGFQKNAQHHIEFLPNMTVIWPCFFLLRKLVWVRWSVARRLFLESSNFQYPWRIHGTGIVYLPTVLPRKRTAKGTWKSPRNEKETHLNQTSIWGFHVSFQRDRYIYNLPSKSTPQRLWQTTSFAVYRGLYYTQLYGLYHKPL